LKHFRPFRSVFGGAQTASGSAASKTMLRLWLECASLGGRSTWESPRAGPHCYDASSSTSAFASFKYRVSNPSVNQPYTGARTREPSPRIPLIASEPRHIANNVS